MSDLRATIALVMALAMLTGCGGSPGPTAVCLPIPVIGRLHGESAQPDRVQLLDRGGQVHVLVLSGAAPYAFAFDPELRVVDRSSGQTIASEGDVVEAGGEFEAGGTYKACGQMVRRPSDGGYPYPSTTP